jgi:hypothetical protein
VATPAAVPVLVVTDVAARLVRRGLIAPGDAGGGAWGSARVLVFRHGPVVCERPPDAWMPDVALHPPPPFGALTAPSGGPTFHAHR